MGKRDLRDLVRRLHRREVKAIIELYDYFAARVGVVIQRMNEDWTTQRITEDATLRALDIVVNTIVDTPIDEIEAIDLEDMVVETADYVGLVIWRRFNGVV